MPTYEYRCPAGHDFEKFYRKISDAPAEVTCPECGAIAERRMSAGAGLLFKGSGFYITDYGKDGKGARKETAAGGDSKSGDTSADKSGGTKSGDAKPSAGGGESGASKPAEKTKSSEPKKSTGGSGGATGGSSGGAA